MNSFNHLSGSPETITFLFLYCSFIVSTNGFDAVVRPIPLLKYTSMYQLLLNDSSEPFGTFPSPSASWPLPQYPAQVTEVSESGKTMRYIWGSTVTFGDNYWCSICV